MKLRKIGWVVDCQYDFMMPDGLLYVKDLKDPDDVGAVQITETLGETVRKFLTECEAVVFTGDWHGFEDAEISESPDFVNTYPPHCMGRVPAMQQGAELVTAVHPGQLVGNGRMWRLYHSASPELGAKIARMGMEIDAHQRHPLCYFIEKTQFNVYTGNQGTEAFVDALLHPEAEIWVCGVASDVCVDQAVMGHTERGYKVTVFKDAIHGLGITPTADLYEKWQSKGVQLA